MKFFYLFVGIIFLIAILVIFFQLLTASTVQVPFFTIWISLNKFTMAVIFLSFFAGTCLTLGIKGFMSSSELNDEFDL